MYIVVHLSYDEIYICQSNDYADFNSGKLSLCNICLQYKCGKFNVVVREENVVVVVAGGQKTTGLGGTTFQPGGHGAVYIPTLPLGYDVGQSLNQRQPQSVSLQNASRVIAPTQYLQQ